MILIHLRIANQLEVFRCPDQVFATIHMDNLARDIGGAGQDNEPCLFDFALLRPSPQAIEMIFSVHDLLIDEDFIILGPRAAM